MEQEKVNGGSRIMLKANNSIKQIIIIITFRKISGKPKNFIKIRLPSLQDDKLKCYTVKSSLCIENVGMVCGIIID